MSLFTVGKESERKPWVARGDGENPIMERRREESRQQEIRRLRRGEINIK